jgi:hypothetical protein
MHIGVVSPARALRVFLPDESVVDTDWLGFSVDEGAHVRSDPARSESWAKMRQLVWA